MRHLMILVVAALALAATVAVVAADEMREGLWEMTTTMEMPGVPYKMPPTVIKHCYSKEDVKDRKKVVASDNKDCTVSDMKTTGNKVTWKMKCTGQNAATMTGEMIMGKDSYTSTMKMQSKETNMTTKVKAKRIGSCP